MTNNKIESLTPEQEAMIPKYLEDTIQAGISTEPCDRPKVERLIKEVYEERGLKAPTTFYWADSPYGASMMHQEISGVSEPQVPLMRGGQELSWLGFYGFATEVLGLEWDGDLRPHLELARNAGWWMPFEEAVFCCDRPHTLKRDAETRLHCENGPAVAYNDGWELFFWHGTAVPKEWIMDKENVDPTLALNHENIEERRCLAEILGWDKVLEQLSPTVIDEDPNPQIGTLLEVSLPDSEEPDRFLRVKCGTGRDFVLPVPGDVSTALEANAWTYGLRSGELKVEVRT